MVVCVRAQSTSARTSRALGYTLHTRKGHEEMSSSPGGLDAQGCGRVRLISSDTCPLSSRPGPLAHLPSARTPLEIGHFLFGVCEVCLLPRMLQLSSPFSRPERVSASSLSTWSNGAAAGGARRERVL
jgi:hypothetical protein